MSEIKQLKRFIYSATVTSGSGSQSFYIDAESREEADERAANKESDGMYADDSEVTDLDALEYEDETTVDDFGDFPLISREQSLIAQLEAAQKERDALREVHIGAGSNTRAAADIYFQLVEELEVPAGGSLVGVIENLKAELSAANEKLLVPAGYCIMPESLTAENGAKGALSGEFFTETDITCEECGGDCDEDDPCKHCNDLGVQTVRTAIGWSTIKDIYKIAVGATAIRLAGGKVEGD
ncbi:TPA: hypothetical protein ACV4T5_004444 [Yersinia enterocolitica]